MLRELGQYFDKTETELSWAVTATLMCRPIGAAVIGLLSDRLGRKWPFVADCIVLLITEMGTGFCKTYTQFLVVRALFGVAMGGIYGNAAVTALEDCPELAQGLFSGVFQSGYPFGFLIASAFKSALVDTTESNEGWRRLYWFGGAIPIVLIVWRILLPETKAWDDRKTQELGPMIESKSAFLSDAGLAIEKHWKLLSYLVLLMAGFNFMVPYFPVLVLG